MLLLSLRNSFLSLKSAIKRLNFATLKRAPSRLLLRARCASRSSFPPPSTARSPSRSVALVLVVGMPQTSVTRLSALLSYSLLFPTLCAQLALLFRILLASALSLLALSFVFGRSLPFSLRSTAQFFELVSVTFRRKDGRARVIAARLFAHAPHVAARAFPPQSPPPATPLQRQPRQQSEGATSNGTVPFGEENAPVGGNHARKRRSVRAETAETTAQERGAEDAERARDGSCTIPTLMDHVRLGRATYQNGRDDEAFSSSFEGERSRRPPWTTFTHIYPCHRRLPVQPYICARWTGAVLPPNYKCS